MSIDESGVTEELAAQNKRKIKDLAEGRLVPGVLVPINEQSFHSTRIIAYLEELFVVPEHLEAAKRSAELAIAEQLSEMRDIIAKAKMQAMVAPANGLQFP